MGKLILTDVPIRFNGYDISGDTNEVSLDGSRDEKDTTNFASSGWREFLAGLKKLDWMVKGFFDPETFDEEAFNAVTAQGATEHNITVAKGSTLGDTAYIAKVRGAKYDALGQIGEVAGFDLGGSGSGVMAKATLMEDSTFSASGNGTGRQLGAVTSSQTLYGLLHGTANTGTSPTIDVVIESDDNAGFTTATTRLTFTQLTDIGSEFLELAGPVTDDYWRAVVTIGGTSSPSFTITLSLGIQ